MSREELRVVRHSRWMDKDNALYPALFEHLFHDELKSVVKKLNEMTTPDLLQELKTTKSSYKKKRYLIFFLKDMIQWKMRNVNKCSRFY